MVFAPRSAIGQKVGGTIIFVVIDGQQISSLGVQMNNVYKIFREWCDKWANLDGGLSAEMVYNEKLTSYGITLTKDTNPLLL